MQYIPYISLFIILSIAFTFVYLWYKGAKKREIYESVEKNQILFSENYAGFMQEKIQDISHRNLINSEIRGVILEFCTQPLSTKMIIDICKMKIHYKFPSVEEYLSTKKFEKCVWNKIKNLVTAGKLKIIHTDNRNCRYVVPIDKSFTRSIREASTSEKLCLAKYDTIEDLHILCK